jgi:acetyltransferase
VYFCVSLWLIEIKGVVAMSVENLDKIFQPKSIAVVGASERKGSVGATLMRNLIERGFVGEIHPINPKHKKIGKLPAYPSIRDLESPEDLAAICTAILDL